MRWGKFWKAIALSLAAIVSLAALFIVIVVRSRPRFEFEFLGDHKSIWSGMDHYFVSSDLDVYTWKEPASRVRERAGRELIRWKKLVAGKYISFVNADGTSVDILTGKNEASPRMSNDFSKDWVTVRIYKDVPDNLPSNIRAEIDEQKGNHL